MNWNLFLTFVVLNIFNVVIQTVKSICTVKCGKGVAALVNAIAYGLYTIVTVYILCDLDLYLKAGVVAACNLVGVYVVKWAEEKSRKDKLWKVEATVNPIEGNAIKDFCETNNIPFSYIDIEKYVLFNFYCATQKESALVRTVLNEHNAKYFVSESKTL